MFQSNRFNENDLMENKDPETNKVWIDAFNKKTDTRRNVPFKSFQLKHCSTKIPFTLARWISTIFKHNNIE